MNSNISPIPLSEIATWFDEGIKSHIDLKASENSHLLGKFRQAKLRILRTVLENCLKGDLPKTGILSNQSELEEYMKARCDLESADFLRQVMPQSTVVSPHH